MNKSNTVKINCVSIDNKLFCLSFGWLAGKAARQGGGS